MFIRSNPIKVQRYRNANLQFYVINDVKRDHISHGTLVGITPGNTFVHTWNFDIPVDSKNQLIRLSIPLGDMVDIFGNQESTADGIQFYFLLPSADMPSLPDLAISTITVFDTPLDSEITFNDFPFKSDKSGTNTYPRLLAYRFRALS